MRLLIKRINFDVVDRQLGTSGLTSVAVNWLSSSSSSWSWSSSASSTIIKWILCAVVVPQGWSDVWESTTCLHCCNKMFTERTFFIRIFGTTVVLCFVWLGSSVTVTTIRFLVLTQKVDVLYFFSFSSYADVLHNNCDCSDLEAFSSMHAHLLILKRFTEPLHVQTFKCWHSSIMCFLSYGNPGSHGVWVLPRKVLIVIYAAFYRWWPCWSIHTNFRCVLWSNDQIWGWW